MTSKSERDYKYSFVLLNKMCKPNCNLKNQILKLQENIWAWDVAFLNQNNSEAGFLKIFGLFKIII